MIGSVLVSLNLSATVSDAWQADGWTYRKEITISRTNVDSTLSNFPLLVKIAADTDIGAHAKSNGYDLRFTLIDGTSLSYERERFSIRAGSGSGVFWVKVPSISSSANTTIYLYYGKSDATDGEDAASVWDANFAGVWHLPNGATLGTLGSTSNDNDGTVSGPTATSGVLDGGASFNGSNNPHDNIDVGTSDGSLNITGDDITISAWAKWNGTDLQGWIISKMHTGQSSGSWGVFYQWQQTQYGDVEQQHLRMFGMYRRRLLRSERVHAEHFLYGDAQYLCHV